LVNRFPSLDCLPSEDKRNSRFREPLSQYAIEIVMLSSQIIAWLFRVQRARAFERDLVSFITVIDINHVALGGQLHPVFVGIFVEAPKTDTEAVRLTMMKTKSPAFLGDVVNVQVRLAAEGLNRGIENGLGLA